MNLKSMSDRELLEEYIHLNRVARSLDEREVWLRAHRYRDEIHRRMGYCPEQLTGMKEHPPTP